LPRLLLLGSAVSALAACGGGAPQAVSGTSGPTQNLAYEQALKRWVDRPEEDLVNAWGVPDRSQRLTDGGQAFEYRRFAGGQLVCATLFTSDFYGKIRTWTYRGSDCKAPELGD
jgi:hypothetical protein